MKTILIFLLIPVFVLSQTKEDLDCVAPYYDGLAAIKKNNSWGFIDFQGNIVIPFREDLVLTKTNDYSYPLFKNNRCLISETKNGITYFGFIDKTGKTVIKPQFLNALNFNNNTTIALQVLKEALGTNDVLGKKVVNYNYYEVTIDIDGNILNYLNPKGIHIILDKEFLQTPPKITSKQISENVYVVKTENNKWNLVTFPN